MNTEKIKIAARGLRWLPGLLVSGPGSKTTVADLLERRAARQPQDVFVRFEGRELTYRDHNEACNRVAHWALAHGIGKGAVVALLMENRPEFLQIWGGLAKTGATVALLNTNLRGRALAHVLDASRCKAVIVGAECVDAWDSLGDDRPAGLPVFLSEDREPTPPLPCDVRNFEEEIAGYSRHDPPRSVRADLRGGDPLFYIYTSGTTGLPKAARFSHARFMGGGTFALLSGFGRRDVMYCPLPLYHTVGGVMCVNAVLRAGATLALRRRFSAKEFWRDVSESGATAFQYIGEICRYLLAQPESEWDRRHHIRFCVGNGLRPDVWTAFQERFAIARIAEFYGATESNVAMLNLEGRMGSVGRPLAGTQVELVRYDVNADTHARGEDGHLIRCDTEEPGELIARIQTGRTMAGRYEGYTSNEATEKKILRDVFEPGDAWFRTGDLLRRDGDGWYYFVDRIGDTFRWKGENVATQEVAETLGAYPGVEICSVYGVEVPGCDGRAGMAAVVMRPGSEFDEGSFFEHAKKALPSYARPAFVRIQDAPEMTATFKVKKVALQREGYDPTTIDDPIYFRDDEHACYRRLTEEDHSRVVAGEARF